MSLPARDDKRIATKVVNCQPDGLYSIILSIAMPLMPRCGVARVFGANRYAGRKGGLAGAAGLAQLQELLQGQFVGVFA